MNERMGGNMKRSVWRGWVVACAIVGSACGGEERVIGIVENEETGGAKPTQSCPGAELSNVPTSLLLRPNLPQWICNHSPDSCLAQLDPPLRRGFPKPTRVDANGSEWLRLEHD